MSKNTIRAYRADLDSFIGSVAPPSDWPSFEAAAAKYLNDGRVTWAPKTTIRRRGTLRRYAEWAGCPTVFLAKYKTPVPPPAQPHPIPEGVDGVLAMIASTNNPRHKALCALTGLVGLRIDEAVNVEPSHFNINQTLTVRGKGDKTRIVPISDGVMEILQPAYQLALKNGTTLVDRTESGARKSIRRHGRRAGLERAISSHDMRATAATAMYDNTKDLRAVQEILGHSDAKTTQGYTGVSEAARRAAVELV